MVFARSQQVAFQVSGDLVSSWPVGNFSGENSVFLWAGLCVALHQSLLFCGKAVASGSLYQLICQLLSMSMSEIHPSRVSRHFSSLLVGQERNLDKFVYHPHNSGI